jgi:hypothetical protein
MALNVLGLGTSGSAPPSVGSSSTTQISTPSFYSNYLANLANQAAAAQQTGGVAPLGQLTQQAIAQAPGAATAYQPFLQMAQQDLQTGRQNPASSGLINQFMSPYQTNVVDEMQRLGEQQIQDVIDPQSKAAAVASGNFDTTMGSGAANALGENERLALQNLTGQEESALNTGYQNAAQQAQSYLSGLNQAGGTAAQSGNLASTAGQTGLATESGLGAQEQAYQQALLNYPMLSTLQEAQALQGYQIPTNTSVSASGPLAGAQYGPSTISQLGGLASIINGMMSAGGTSSTGGANNTGGANGSSGNPLGTLGSLLGNAGSSIYSGLSGLFGPNTNGAPYQSGPVDTSGTNTNTGSYLDLGTQTTGTSFDPNNLPAYNTAPVYTPPVDAGTVDTSIFDQQVS